MRTHSKERTAQDVWPRTQTMQREGAAVAAKRAFGAAAYRVAWLGAGISDADCIASNWDAIPFLKKEDLIEGARQSPPYGDRLAVPQGDIAHVFVAPGPLYMPYTAGDLDRIAASFAAALLSCGLQASDTVDQTTMYNWVIAATALDKALLKIGCGVVPGGVGQTDRHLDAICDLGINAIVAFPTFLEHLLEMAGQQGQSLPLRKAAVMGELSHPDAKARMRRDHGIDAREFYGTADVGAVAWECAEGCGMHLRDDLLVEFVDPATGLLARPVSGSPVEIVVTDLHRQAMPIIRLRTGDLIDGLETGPCACGNPAPRFSRIIGRSSEITKVKGMFVVPRLVQDVFAAQDIQRNFCLHVRRSESRQDILALAVAGPPLANIQAIKAGVESALRLKIEIEFVDELPDHGPRLVDERVIGLNT